MKKGALTGYEVVGSDQSQPYCSTNVRLYQEDALGFAWQGEKKRPEILFTLLID